MDRQRKGVNLVVGTIVFIVILVILAALLLGVTRGTLPDVDDFMGVQQDTAGLQTREAQISSFRSTNDAVRDWSQVYPQCEDPADVISTATPQDTLCGCME